MGLRIIRRSEASFSDQELELIKTLVDEHSKRHREDEDPLPRDGFTEMKEKIRAMRHSLTTSERALNALSQLETDIRKREVEVSKTQLPVQAKTLLDLL